MPRSELKNLNVLINIYLSFLLLSCNLSESLTQDSKNNRSPRENDSLALVSIYNTTDGENWTRKENWLSTNSLEAWEGVAVDENRVSKLDLSNSGLKKSINNSIKSLNALEILNLSNNKITGISNEINSLTKLISLRMDTNQLENIPDHLETLILLDTLSISSNRIDSLPETITELKNLKDLNLSRNQIKFLPDSLGNLSNLKSLNISFNVIDSLPHSIGNITYISEFNVSNNFIKKLPPEIQKWKVIESVNLEGNALDSLPIEITELINLFHLDVSGNNLKTLPDDIILLNQFIPDSTLDLWGNQICNLSSTKSQWADKYDSDWNASGAQNCGPQNLIPSIK